MGTKFRRMSRHLPDWGWRGYSQEGMAHAGAGRCRKGCMFRECGVIKCGYSEAKGSSGRTGGVARSDTVEGNVGETRESRPWAASYAVTSYLDSSL